MEVLSGVYFLFCTMVVLGLVQSGYGEEFTQPPSKSAPSNRAQSQCLTVSSEQVQCNASGIIFGGDVWNTRAALAPVIQFVAELENSIERRDALCFRLAHAHETNVRNASEVIRGDERTNSAVP